MSNSLEELGYVAICEADHPLQLQLFLSTKWNWYSLNQLKGSSLKNFRGGLLLTSNLPEVIYKNAKELSALSYHWIVLDTKYSTERLTEVAQKAGVLLHFIQFPFQTKYWSNEFLEEVCQVIERQEVIV